MGESLNPASSRRRSGRSQAIPPTVPLLPVRDNVHFPQLVGTLLIGREISLRALQSAIRKERMVLVVGQRDVAVDEPRAEDLYRIGTLCEVVQIMPMPDGTMRVILRGLSRSRVERFLFKRGFYTSEYEVLLEEQAIGPASEALRREAIEEFQQIASLGKQVPVEVLEVLPSIDDTGHLADLMADHLTLRASVKQELLEETDCARRMEKLIQVLASERQVLELQNDLRHRVEEELGNTQREYYLREQLKIIQSELSGGDEAFSPDNEALATAIRAAGMPQETEEKAILELKRLERAPSSSPENMVIRNYLDWLIGLPWTSLSQDRLDVKAAAQILNEAHFGLEKVKDRVLDFLAVRQLSGSLRGPILCFVGPPGVGKTSLGRSIAEALGRKFVRLSLGGIRDEAEIRGHRRTYVGSMPGRIIQGVKSCGTRNPVFMLDEIDKMTTDFRGDPTSALLEALDPEQNEHFSDHYIEASFDLSAVMFIATANVLENVPAPLRDRMEVIQFRSYTEQEKLEIARRFLVPKMASQHGLKTGQLKVDDRALQQVIREYTRESGVRSLEREIATLCRKTARRIAEGKAEKVRLSTKDLGSFLGRPRFRYGMRQDRDQVGASTGLVYTEVGGDTVTIEASLMPSLGPEPNVQLTGSLGNVMKESALTAATYAREHASSYGLEQTFANDMHIHVPEGAVPKDGPSAGVTILTAIVSAMTGRPVQRDLAMTGEITLRGKVLAVGGIREKLLAAHRAAIREVAIPRDNESDLEDLPAGVREQLQVHFVQTVDEVLRLALVP